MATTDEADSPQERRRGWRPAPNRLPMVVIAGLILLLLLGAILAPKKEKPKKPAKDAGVRALVLPTADRARTVVVPPCGTGTRVTSRNAAAQIDTPGATVVQVPPAEAARTLLIPRCSANVSAAGAKTVAQVPSSVFVLTTGATEATGTKGSTETGTIEPQSQLIVPSASAGQMVVVPPCTGTGRADKATVLSPTSGGRTALVAPPC